MRHSRAVRGVFTSGKGNVDRLPWQQVQCKSIRIREIAAPRGGVALCLALKAKYKS